MQTISFYFGLLQLGDFSLQVIIMNVALVHKAGGPPSIFLEYKLEEPLAELCSILVDLPPAYMR